LNFKKTNNHKNMNRLLLISITAAMLLASCVNPSKKQVEEKIDALSTLPYTNGKEISIEFTKGKEFYHPLIVFWAEDLDGNYLGTLYASQSIATGTFKFGVSEGKNWSPGERRRPAALPYWGHRRGIKAPDGLYLPTPQNPLPDAITGATPKNSFSIKTFLNPDFKKQKLFMEINQTWDWNHHWHNNLFPDDEEYKTSCQPALVYMVEIDLQRAEGEYEFKPVGHSHPSGKTGELFNNLSTITTALEIAKKVSVKILPVD
jgi:hypothetical protein